MIRKWLKWFIAGGVIINCYHVLGLRKLVRKGGWALNKVAEGSAAEEAVQMLLGQSTCVLLLLGGWEFNLKSSF